MKLIFNFIDFILILTENNFQDLLLVEKNSVRGEQIFIYWKIIDITN